MLSELVLAIAFLAQGYSQADYARDTESELLNALDRIIARTDVGFEEYVSLDHRLRHRFIRFRSLQMLTRAALSLLLRPLAELRIVECFEPETNACPIVPVCRLGGVLSRALDGFFAVPDASTLADLAGPGALRNLAKDLQIETAGDMAER